MPNWMKSPAAKSLLWGLAAATALAATLGGIYWFDKGLSSERAIKFLARTHSAILDPRETPEALQHLSAHERVARVRNAVGIDSHDADVSVSMQEPDGNLTLQIRVNNLRMIECKKLNTEIIGHIWRTRFEPSRETDKDLKERIRKTNEPKSPPGDDIDTDGDANSDGRFSLESLRGALLDTDALKWGHLESRLINNLPVLVPDGIYESTETGECKKGLFPSNSISVQFSVNRKIRSIVNDLESIPAFPEIDNTKKGD